jgi:hypothetical protein
MDMENVADEGRREPMSIVAALVAAFSFLLPFLLFLDECLVDDPLLGRTADEPLGGNGSRRTRRMRERELRRELRSRCEGGIGGNGLEGKCALHRGVYQF